MCCNTPRTKHSPLSDMTSFAGCKWVAIAGEPATLTDLETTTRADVLDGDVAVGDLCCLTSGGGHPRNGAHDILRVRGVTRHTVTAAVVRVRRVATIVRRPPLLLFGAPPRTGWTRTSSSSGRDTAWSTGGSNYGASRASRPCSTAARPAPCSSSSTRCPPRTLRTRLKMIERVYSDSSGTLFGRPPPATSRIQMFAGAT